MKKPKKPAFKKPQLAFVQKNFRTLDFESKTILLSHAATLLACFFPWASHEPLYGETEWLNAFSGASWMIGALVFLLSLFAIFMFADELFERHRIKFKISHNAILGILSFQEILLLICAWSVLHAVGRQYSGSQIRFGLVFCLLLQVVALVSVYLQSRAIKKENVLQFFQHPAESGGTPEKK